jgi:hypothetical protein
VVSRRSAAARGDPGTCSPVSCSPRGRRSTREPSGHEPIWAPPRSLPDPGATNGGDLLVSAAHEAFRFCPSLRAGPPEAFRKPGASLRQDICQFVRRSTPSVFIARKLNLPRCLVDPRRLRVPVTQPRTLRARACAAPRHSAALHSAVRRGSGIPPPRSSGPAGLSARG